MSMPFAAVSFYAPRGIFYNINGGTFRTNLKGTRNIVLPAYGYSATGKVAATTIYVGMLHVAFFDSDGWPSQPILSGNVNVAVYEPELD